MNLKTLFIITKNKIIFFFSQILNLFLKYKKQGIVLSENYFIFFFVGILCLFFLVTYFAYRFFSVSNKYILCQQKNNILTEEKNSLLYRLEIITKSMDALSDKFKVIANEAAGVQTNHLIRVTTDLVDRIHKENHHVQNTSEKHMETLFSPLKDTATKLEETCNSMERNQNVDRVVLKQQIDSILLAANSLQAETAKVINSLRSPNVRGNWGEVQLARTLELSGMEKNRDFVCQKEINGMRPDVIVYLPKGAAIIIDAKTPLMAYTNAMNAQTETEKKSMLLEHAKKLKEQINSLAKKEYWNTFEGSPDFVILYLPGESLLNSALEVAPDLLEYALDKRVVVLTASSLFAFLRVIGFLYMNLGIVKNNDEFNTNVLALGKSSEKFNGFLLEFEKSMEKMRKNYLELDRFVKGTFLSDIENISAFHKKKPAEITEKTILTTEKIIFPEE